MPVPAPQGVSAGPRPQTEARRRRAARLSPRAMLAGMARLGRRVAERRRTGDGRGLRLGGRSGPEVVLGVGLLGRGLLGLRHNSRKTPDRFTPNSQSRFFSLGGDTPRSLQIPEIGTCYPCGTAMAAMAALFLQG